MKKKFLILTERQKIGYDNVELFLSEKLKKW